MKIGLFGGTFNPVHLGHVSVARQVKQHFGLDTVYIIPSAIPPHKNCKGIVDAEDRLEMVRLAFQEKEGFIVSDVELKRAGLSYTIDTVKHFKSLVSPGTRMYLLMGVDAFLDIDTWMRFKALFSLVSFIVVNRPERDNRDQYASDEIKGIIHTHISDKYIFSVSEQCYDHPAYLPIHVLKISPVELSSTRIRACLKKHIAIDAMVPPSVKEYIEKKGLYL